MFIEKDEGGNHMICTCSYHFCYVCQGTWSDVHHHCETREEGQKTSCKKGLTNCILGTLLRQMEKAHVYKYICVHIATRSGSGDAADRYRRGFSWQWYSSCSSYCSFLC